MAEELKCCVCSKTNAELGPNDDVRPYGPGGQPICYACAMSTPELKEEATSQLIARIDSIIESGGTLVIGDDLYGVQKLEEEES